MVPASDTPAPVTPPDAAAIAHAATTLEAGGLVAFPTETVYGLGGDAENPAAVAAIYAAKGRPANHPVIVHLSEAGDPEYWTGSLTEPARQLIAAFWPGPLTLIVKRAAHIPDAVSGGQDSVGLRCPSHPVAQALLRAFKRGHGGVAAPSANRFGHVSPTTAQHVHDEFGPSLEVLDGGACAVGIESTIVDLSRGFAALLRPGHITPQQIAEVLGVAPRLPDGSDATAPRASGTLKAHYAPRTPLALLDLQQMAAALAARAPGEAMAVVVRASDVALLSALVQDAPEVRFVAAPESPERYAQDLYGLLRALDRADVSRILVERLPAGPEWDAVNDRLGRAAAAFLAGD